jgi:hypothetical protein
MRFPSPALAKSSAGESAVAAPACIPCVQFASFCGKISQVPGGDRDEAAIGFLDGGYGVRWLSVGWQRRSRTQQRFNFGSNHRSCDGFSSCRNICAQDKKKAGQEYPDACVGSHSATSCRKMLMNKKVFLGIALTLPFTTFSLPASSQAIAESVILGSGSSTAAVKAGSALNSALKQGGGRLAGEVQQQLLRPSQTSQPKTSLGRKSLLPRNQNAPRNRPSVPRPGTFIVSVQGAETSSAVTDKPIPTGRGETPVASPTNLKGDTTSIKPGSQKYKSAITLSFPK